MIKGKVIVIKMDVRTMFLNYAEEETKAALNRDIAKQSHVASIPRYYRVQKAVADVEEVAVIGIYRPLEGRSRLLTLLFFGQFTNSTRTQQIGAVGNAPRKSVASEKSPRR
jgi:hypothetical protein